jgi:ABC-type glycerol-3-phosphate transport system substrate-binding protein
MPLFRRSNNEENTMNLQQRISRRDALKIGAVSAAAAGLTLAGCGPSTSASGPTSVNLMTWGDATGLKTAFDSIAGIYPNLAKDIKFNVVVAGANDFDVANAFRLALSSHKNLPDVIEFNRTQIAEFALSGALRDLSDIVSPVKNDLYAGAVQLASYQGKFVGVPFQVKSKLFYYRADLFDQAGITLDDLSTTDGFLTAGQKLHARFPDKYILNLGTQPQQYIIGELLSAYPGLEFYDKASNAYQITKNPAFSQAFTFLQQIHGAGITLPIDDFSTDWAQAFQKEQICGVLCANWMKAFLPQYSTAAQTGKWKVVPWPKLSPTLSDQSTGSEAGGSVFVIPANAPHGDAAIEYMKHYMLDAKGSVAQWKQNGVITPLLKSAQPAVLDFFQNGTKPANVTDASWALQPQNFFGKDFQQIEFTSYDSVKVLDYDPSATKEITILLQALENILGGKADVGSALAQAQSDMQSQIGNPYQV